MCAKWNTNSMKRKFMILQLLNAFCSFNLLTLFTKGKFSQKSGIQRLGNHCESPEGLFPATCDSAIVAVPPLVASSDSFNVGPLMLPPIRYESSSSEATLWVGRRTFSTLFSPADCCPAFLESRGPGDCLPSCSHKFQFEANTAIYSRCVRCVTFLLIRWVKPGW